MKIEAARKKTRVVKIGSVRIGGANPVAVQSMLKVRACDTAAAVRQIKRLEAAGCEIVRLAVKDPSDAAAIKTLKRHTRLPLVADIHFDWRLAIAAIDHGADKIRLNPGNIYRQKEIAEVVSALKSHRIPLRIGVNSGSIRYSGKSGAGIAEKLAAGTLDYVRKIEKLKFYDIVLSLKASNVRDTLAAYRKISGRCDYPLHLGVTAAGLPMQGMVKSSIAIGALLLEGIGDTIRVSLTGSPEEEVKVARAILEALELRSFGPQIVSCPTCGRCEVDLIAAVAKLEEKLLLRRFKPAGRPKKVAMMGCVVNGPGEAKEADIGVAFGKKDGLLFKAGKPCKKIAFKDAVNVLLRELK